MKTVTTSLIPAALFLALVPDVSAQAETGSFPNIILMMADDMGMGDTSAYQDFTGNADEDQISTPNMERLARMGVRFVDAHTPASRCTLTRYSLLTGRYSWRNRLKHWVLFGVQGDPMIERDRPTIASMLKQRGYRTGLVGKWHVGLRYRRSDGRPADAWKDADLTQPMFDTPLDHGFDFCRFTSRSHATSGPSPGGKKQKNSPNQSIGPGHIHGREIIGATGNGKLLVDDGPEAYVLHQLGGRHLTHAMMFLDEHLESNAEQPFFLYYASNSNHGPYTPDTELQGTAVKGAARNMAGDAMDVRSDYIFENDVALGKLLDRLRQTNDPRQQGSKLIENTIVVFTSDNGAEKAAKTSTGPFRSNKGSVYEGGHRVPLLVSWPAGNVGDGKESTAGRSDASLIGLQDLYATFQEITGADREDYRSGLKGGEDSVSVLPAWRGEPMRERVMFFNDHKEADDPAVVAFRKDDPTVNGETVSGQWKLFFDHHLLRAGRAVPVELFDLATDPQETRNLLGEARLDGLVKHLSDLALDHRTAGGHQLVPLAGHQRIQLQWKQSEREPDDATRRIDLRQATASAASATLIAQVLPKSESGQTERLELKIRGLDKNGKVAKGFDTNPKGLGILGGRVKQVDANESLEVSFDRDVIIESAEIVAGNGVCGGSYTVAGGASLAIYCIDADIDAKDQHGILSDIGILLKGQVLVLNSTPHYEVEAPGQWRLGSITIRTLEP